MIFQKNKYDIHDEFAWIFLDFNTEMLTEE